jgi:hypothetical protein
MSSINETISIGCQVEIILRDRYGKEERLSALIVPAESADFAHGYLGVDTPLAQALLGESAGVIIPYLKDDIHSIEVVSVTKSTLPPPQDAKARRQATLEAVRRQVEDSNLRTFASSFSGKWGDYDPDSIPVEKKPKDQD